MGSLETAHMYCQLLGLWGHEQLALNQSGAYCWHRSTTL